MKVFFLALLLFSFFYVDAQKTYVGPPNNVGREYGNPKMPLMVSHLAGKNRDMLKRANKNSRHSVFGKILCFRKLCRIQSGHSASLKSISFKKFRKKVQKHAKKGEYKDVRATPQPGAVTPKAIAIDTTTIQPPASPAEIKKDSLIILGAEVLFEVNRSTLRSEHFSTLNPIVDYLISHPERSVTISGHTDNTGNEKHNLTLSKKRADVVAEYLVNNGVDINRIETSGLGSSKPIAENTTDKGRKKNRRVELLIHHGQ
jgi:outer membrane protein OmpA-like peptidoglycan-associated protein